MTNTDYRAMVKRRRTESKATTALHKYCLDVDLLQEVEKLKSEKTAVLAALEEERAAILAEGEGRRAKPSTAHIDAQIAEVAKKYDPEIERLTSEIEKLTFILKFQAVPEGVYSKLAAETDEDDPLSVRLFMNALVRAGWAGATKDGEPVDLGDFEDVWDSLTFGETDLIRGKVFQANLRVVDIPF